MNVLAAKYLVIGTVLVIGFYCYYKTKLYYLRERRRRFEAAQFEDR